MRRLTSEGFIIRATTKHSGKYDYSKVEYLSSTIKVVIVCREHGDFTQSPNSHLSGVGCPVCSGNSKSNVDRFTTKANLKHKNRYDYSKVKYVNAFTNVLIICNKHGEFWQKPNSHLSGYGCKKCGLEQSYKKNNMGKERFIILSQILHGSKYDYSNVNYINNRIGVNIVCPQHGSFKQSPYVHIKGGDCKKCGYIKSRFKNRKTLNDFIKDCELVHGDKYDYSLVEYIGTDHKVKIICREHGIFEQRCSKHLQNQGCPVCSESKLEKEIRLFLISNNIEYKQQYGKKSDLFYLNGQLLDFYLPAYKIGIECQGEQHFNPVDFGNRGYDYTNEYFLKGIILDIRKYSECVKNNIEVIYYCDEKFKREYIGELYCNLNDLIKKIKE